MRSRSISSTHADLLRVGFAWGMQHSLIATTMLVVGLFAVLS